LKKRLLVLALALALATVFTHGAIAAGAGNGCSCPNRASSPGYNQVPLAEKLNLSDRQVQQLKEINLNTYQNTRPLKIKLLDAKFELRQLRIDGKDKTAIEAKTKDIKDLRDQLHRLQQQKRQKVQAILTSEQQAKLKTMRAPGHHGGWDKQGYQQPE